MKVVKFKHENVQPDGTFQDSDGNKIGGAVHTEERMARGLQGSAPWRLYSTARTEDGVVEGITIWIESDSEMEELEDNPERIKQIAREHGLRVTL